MKTLIHTSGKDNYYLVNRGMGGFLNPPNDAEHNFSIEENSNGSYSLRGILDCDYIPQKVKEIAQKVLNENQANIKDEDWIKHVYSYFNHSYSKDGIERNASNCICFGKFWDNKNEEKEYPAEYHLGYMFIKTFDPSHEIRLDLMNRSE